MTDAANPYRLPRHALPRRYDLALAPDLDAATFTGEVRITLEVQTAATEVVLNAAELAISSVTIGGADAAWALHPDEERLVVTPAVVLDPGTVELTITFTGVLNDKLRGFYRSTFRDAGGAERVIATSQLQPTDCRRAFPCWDEPDFKAVFGVTLEVDDGLLAISNSPEISRVAVGGKQRITFADTMAMSTYLVAFVVGPLEATDALDVNGTPLRVVHVPGKAHLTRFALDCGRFALAWFERYYGIPYPGDKVDLVALPDFAAGAMENLGCITFRESLLLVDPASATHAEAETVVDVICHELAHMWFGDLVTMGWWNGIWLNEAFATFMEIMACDAYRPEWERWVTFGLERTVALETDSLGATRTVEYEVRSPADCEAMFDVLTYQKGGALLRMLQQYLGEDRFQAGVRHYLTKHAYANTETGDLWDALEEATSEPVRTMMDSWIWQAGYPLVRAHLAGGELVLRQRRFGFTEEATADPTQWVIPIHVRQVAGGAAQERKVLLDSDEVRLPLLSGDPVVVVNSGGSGFMRVAYDDVLHSRLDGEALAGLSTLERYALVDDSWAAVVAGLMPAAGFLDVADRFGEETDFAVWQAIAGGLRACDRLVDGEAREALRARVRRLVTPALDRLGWIRTDGEDELTGRLRGLLVALSAIVGRDPATIERARLLFDASATGSGGDDPELVAASTSVVAATGDGSDFDRFVEGFRNAATPQEQLRFLYSLGEFGDAELIRRAVELAFSGEVRSQNAPFLIGRCIANREHGALAWRLLRERWQEATTRFPDNTIIRMVDSVKLLNTPEAEADVGGFFAEHPIPQAGNTLAQVLERQRVNVALRRRDGAALTSALTA